jgi:hypothetical protein
MTWNDLLGLVILVAVTWNAVIQTLILRDHLRERRRRIMAADARMEQAFREAGWTKVEVEHE